jgi:mercuric ion binding protein
MKGIIMRTLTFLAIALLPVASALAAMQSAILDVQNMTCSLCPLTIKKALQKVPGVEDAKVDFDHKTAIVQFDPAKTNAAALVKATTDAGFPSTLHK